MKRSIIKSTGRYVPDRHVTNEELAGLMDTSNEWIVQRTGIEARYWVREGEDVGTSDLAYEASIIALERADWNMEIQLRQPFRLHLTNSWKKTC